MKVIVVAKTPKLEVIEASSDRALADLRERDPDALAALIASTRRQRAALSQVVEALDASSATVEVLSRADFTGAHHDTDLVVVVGGDGTVLDASHWLRDTPVLAVNSDPETSVGYFCACDREGFAEVLAEVLEGRSPRTQLHRIAITVNGIAFPFPCLNDILVSSPNPAAMSRYVITAGSRTEIQASSGIWISTPAGSTGGVRSAGGTVMPLEGALIQYAVREPYGPRQGRYELLRGVRHIREGLVVRSRMPEGSLYVDGPYLQIPFGMGDLLELREGPQLRVLGMHPALRER